MGFWRLKTLKHEEFRPGIYSRVEAGKNLAMAYMEISPHNEGNAHRHPFDQCGIVMEGEIEISIGEEKKVLKTMETYFIPAGENHNWKTNAQPAKIVDVTFKQS